MSGPLIGRHSPAAAWPRLTATSAIVSVRAIGFINGDSDSVRLFGNRAVGVPPRRADTEARNPLKPVFFTSTANIPRCESQSLNKPGVLRVKLRRAGATPGGQLPARPCRRFVWESAVGRQDLSRRDLTHGKSLFKVARNQWRSRTF